MNRFFIDKIEKNMILDGDNHAHLAYSLRLKHGDSVCVFCGDGFDYICRIIAIKRNETQLEIIDKISNDSESVIDIDVYLSLIKPDKMSFAYQKLTELGVKSIFPLITEHTQSKKGEFNGGRYSKVCAEACKQCGRSVVPIVHNPVSLGQMLENSEKYDIVIFAYEKAEDGIKEFLQAKKEVERVAIVVGPEGGFSEREASLLKDGGVVPVTLGKRILRTETAVVAVTGAVMYEYGEWSKK